MKFYIVTPCFNSLSWLKNCIRSVADQAEAGVEVHHHVQDGLSSDGTPEWLQQWQQEHADCPGYTFTYESCKDKGMYDAINRAWEKMPQNADVTAHLNSDEQYLPHALKQVAEAYARYPEAELIEGSFIIVEADGSYRCHRRPVPPNKWRSMTVCEIITCSAFHRADVFRRHGIRFDIQYRSIGDVIFFRDIIRSGVKIKTVPTLVTSSYALTGSNLAWTAVTQKEGAAYWASIPQRYVRCHGFSYRYSNLWRRVIDVFCPPPVTLEIYHGDAGVRSCEPITKPTCRWNQWAKPRQKAE